MKLGRLLVATCVAWLLLLPAMTAWALPGTVRLKNGGWIEGEIVALLPGESVTVRAPDGATKKIPWAEVERVDQAQAAPAAGAAAPAPPAAAPAAPATAPTATTETPSAAPVEPVAEPATPAPQRTVLALDDPNTHRVLLMSGDTKIYFLGLPRSDASSVALRFERYVREAELADCKEVVVTIDGVATRYPLQHKVGTDGTGLREIVQAQAKIELIEQMANAKDIKFDICQKPRPLSFVAHHAQIVRYVKQFKELIGKPQLAYKPNASPRGRDFEVAPSGYGPSGYTGGESLSDLERERREISIGGPIALTAAGGVVAVNGLVFLFLAIGLDDMNESLCASADPEFAEEECDDGTDPAPFYIVGVGGLVVGAVALAIGIPTLSSAIKERRELGRRIKELRPRRSDRQPHDGPRLARSTPVWTVQF